MLTARQIAERLAARGEKVSHRTVLWWLKTGVIEGAQLIQTPANSYWVAPASSVKAIKRPPMGRPRKPKPEARRPGRGRKG